MEDINILLSDRYVEFANSIIDLFKQKKLIEEQLASNAAEYNTLVISLYKIKNQVYKAQDKFESWKKECLSNLGDG